MFESWRKMNIAFYFGAGAEGKGNYEICVGNDYKKNMLLILFWRFYENCDYL